MTSSEALQTAKDDLTQLAGKKVELSREKSRLVTHRDVFKAQLDRIEGELSTVQGQLDDVSARCRRATSRITWLRLKVVCHVTLQVAMSAYSLLTFALINLLNLLHVTLLVLASLTRTVLDTQMASFDQDKSPTSSNSYEDRSCLT